MEMSRRRGRGRGRRRRGRPRKPVRMENNPNVERFTPHPRRGHEPIYLEPAELEAIRLVDSEGLSQDDAGKRMNISRGTVWRLLHSGRKKVSQALTEGRPIHISTEDSPRPPLDE